MSRFNQYRYALIAFFRKRGYTIDSYKKTIRINPDELTAKENERLRQLVSWGFKVVSESAEQDNYKFGTYEFNQSFIDFADEIMQTYFPS